MKALVLVLVLAAAGVTWVALKTESSEAPSLAEGDGESGVEPQGEEPVELVDPGSGDSQGDGGLGNGDTTSPPSPDEGAASDTGSSAPSGPSPELAAYMQKYGHMTELERSVALAQLTENIRYERNLLFDSKFASGDYIVRHPGDPQLPPPETNEKGRAMERDARTQSEFDGSVEVRHAELRFEEAPDFYRLLDELDWLRNEVGQ